jgi:hypothetical protein
MTVNLLTYRAITVDQLMHALLVNFELSYIIENILMKKVNRAISPPYSMNISEHFGPPMNSIEGPSGPQSPRSGGPQGPRSGTGGGPPALNQKS